MPPGQTGEKGSEARVVLVVLVVVAIASVATVAISDDLTTNGSTAARYMVNLGRDFGDSVTLVDAASKLYDYAKYSGNGALWSRLNDGSLAEQCVTFLHDDPDMGPNFLGYQFKHAATVSELNLTDVSFGDGSRFNATPAVEVLTAPLKQGGTCVAVPGVTWNTASDSTLVGGASNSYTITADTPITGAWGVRLAGDPLDVEYTTDSGSTWTPVTGLDKGRYPADYLDLEAFLWNYENAFLFTFDPVSGIDGIRVASDGGGPADGNGFIASYEFEVCAVPEPAAMLLLLLGSAPIRRR